MADSGPSLWEALAGRAPGRPIGPAEPDLFQAVLDRLNPARARPQLRSGIETKELVSVRGEGYVMLRSPGERPAYLRLDPDEVALAQLMDGSRTVASLVGDFARITGRLAPQQVLRVVADLAGHRMLEELPVDAFHSLERLRSRSRLRRLGAAIADVARGRRYAVTGVDPLVTALYRWGGWLFFTRPATALMMVLALVGGALFVMRWVDGAQSTFVVADSQVLGLVVLLGLNVVCLVAHELGHALAAKHAGRRVPRGGVLLFFGIPSVFVETSDVWMADRRARLRTAAAGPAAAVVLAGAINVAAAFVPDLAPVAFKLGFLWYLNVLFNLNPLLPLDGYHLLMDWLEMPNLRTRGLGLTIGRLRRRRIGLRGLSGEDRLYALYGHVAILWLVITLGLAVRIWKDRVDGLGAAMWHEGLGGKVGFILVAALLFAPLVGSALSWFVRRVRGWLADRHRLDPADDLQLRLKALRNSRLVFATPATLAAVASTASWLVVPAGRAAAIPEGGAVVAGGGMEARLQTDASVAVAGRAFSGDVVRATDDNRRTWTWRATIDSRLLALGTPEEGESAPPLALGGFGRPVVPDDGDGPHPGGDVPPPLIWPAGAPGAPAPETDDRLERRLRRLVLILLLLSLVAIVVAIPAGNPWSELPSDRVLAVVASGSATVHRSTGATVGLRDGDRIALADGDRTRVAGDGVVELDFQGGAVGILCASTETDLVDAGTAGEPRLPAVHLTISRGAALLDTTSSSAAFLALAATVDAGQVVRNEGEARFLVSVGSVTVERGTVIAGGTPVTPTRIEGCPPAGVEAAPDSSLGDASDRASHQPMGSSPSPSMTPDATGMPSTAPSATPMSTLSPTLAPTITPTTTPTPLPQPPTFTPAPVPTAAPTPPPTPLPTPRPGFGIACGSRVLEAAPGSTVVRTCTVTSIGSFSAPVLLICNLPSIAGTCTMTPSTVTPTPGAPAASTLVVVIGSSVSTIGCHPLTVTATSGSITHQVALRLDVGVGGTPSC